MGGDLIKGVSAVLRPDTANIQNITLKPKLWEKHRTASKKYKTG